MSIADALLRLAVWISPPERSGWMEAMKAEYAALDSGKLRWALGCVAVSIRWRLSQEGIYVALVCASIWFLATDPLFLVLAGPIPREYLSVGLYPPLVYMTVICLVLGAYRPNNLVLTSVALVLISNALGIYQLYFVMPQMFGYRQAAASDFFLRQLSIHDAKPLIGIWADFGACLLGGLVGRGLARQFRPAR